MRRTLLVSLLLLAAPLATLAQGNRELRIGFWNVERLIEGRYSRDQISTKLKKDAKIIKALRSDILGLAEVGSPELLDKLLQKKLKKMNFVHVLAKDTGDDQAIDIALASRFPFEPVLLERPEGTLGLAVGRFEFGGKPLYVAIVHAQPGEAGTAAAERLTRLVTEELPARESEPLRLVVLGDFGGDESSPLPAALIAAGLEASVGSPDEEFRWSHAWREDGKPRRELHDHIFISKTLADQEAPVRWIPGSSRIRRFPYHSETQTIGGHKIEWPVEDYGVVLGFSDHYPVSCRLLVPR